MTRSVPTKPAVAGKPEYRVEALAKGLRILSLFTEQRPTWRVSDIAPAVGMPLPTVYRVVMTLTAEGYLDHLPNGDYRPAVRVLTLGGAALRSLDLVTAATPGCSGSPPRPARRSTWPS
ncbi:helix-turn-helix domain-containing protein [Paractinoplanes durhamensis]|uniref:helix-turn-helix domain-containing protein n=1 Tax=Paractinoplanes durhamensis TaxID=113563 RepID=UPI003634CDF3